MNVARDLAGRLRPPALLCQPDAVLAGDHPSPRQHLREKLIQSALHFLAHRRIAVVGGHDVHVNVSIAGVAEAGDRESIFLPQPGGEFSKIRQAASRDDDVLVQLGEPGGLQ